MQQENQLTGEVPTEENVMETPEENLLKHTMDILDNILWQFKQHSCLARKAFFVCSQQVANV